MDLLSIPKHLEVNHRPQLELAAAQIEAWGNKPNTPKLKALVASVRKIGVDTGCLDETLQEYIDTPPSEERERRDLLDRIQCNIYDIVEEYGQDWLEYYDKAPTGSSEHPLYAKWKEHHDRVADANMRDQKKGYGEPYLAIHFIETDDGRFITFGEEAKRIAGYFEIAMTLEEGSVAIVVTLEHYNNIYRKYSGNGSHVWAYMRDGKAKSLIFDC